MYFKHNDSNVGPIAAAAFPRNRKDVSVKEFVGPMNVNSYWDGGSKDEYVLVDLATKRKIEFPTSHPYFDRKSDGERCGNLVINELPENTALVCGGTFMGKPATVRILLRPDNMASLLPAPPSLSDEERSALNIIGSMKGGYRKDEFARCGLGFYDADNSHIVNLAAQGLVRVNKAGSISITTDGRNARSA